jgi:tetratricopeptide (TPR) repeat protein
MRGRAFIDDTLQEQLWGGPCSGSSSLFLAVFAIVSGGGRSFAQADNLGSLSEQAKALYDQGKYTEAATIAERILKLTEVARGPNDLQTVAALNNLGAVYWQESKYPLAEQAYSRTLAIEEKALGPDHLDVAQTLNNLGVLSAALQDWLKAEHYYQRATDIIEQRTALGGLGQSVASKQQSETTRNSGYFQGLVKTAWRAALVGSTPDPATIRAMYLKAQWGLSSEAAQALAQMSARGATGDPELAKLVRERQDLTAEWQSRDAARTAAFSQLPEKRNKESKAANSARLTAIETRIGEIDRELKSKFPDYSALASPHRPVSRRCRRP